MVQKYTFPISGMYQNNRFSALFYFYYDIS